MSTLKCKMCGGALTYEEGKTVIECEYCGSLNTLPNIGDEKRLQMFDRANRLRANCDFERASGVYETVVAEYPEEAEAYWGLILCKYGIEYVDDPATGKKVPTCHRSSFDGVFDDSNFDMVMEYCDAASRNVYRDEAKQIEEIRKGIIEISSKEEPYDIFICYKETDENGDRTVDSLIAQDVYDVLVKEGYKVFFSRITLEDKLGQEYEPYIFAALNSAKVMLAVGTCYEHFNAVWVKNEWTRFLKLMETDKSKYLIPCYKNIDAYDMPKDFGKLQAQDMGKVGAIQDLVRGIRKIVGEKKTEVVINNHASGANALLQRGQIALEDGDWKKADLFFEEVLNTDPKCAEAYWGKFLASKQVKSTAGFFESVTNSIENLPAGEIAEDKLTACEQEKDHIKKMTEEYSVEGYLSGTDIQKKYNYDLTYTSSVNFWMNKRKSTLESITGDRSYSRAMQYGDLSAVKAGVAALENLFDTKIDEATQSAEESKQSVVDGYSAFIAEIDDKIIAEHKRCIERRDAKIEETYNLAKSLAAGDIASNYESALEKYKTITGYKDVDEQIDFCIKEISVAESKRRKKIIITVCSVVTFVILAVVIAVVVVKVIIPNSKYSKALELYNAGNYSEAADSFAAMDGYKDSADYVNKSKYAMAKASYDAGEYGEAKNEFENLGGYGDSKKYAFLSNLCLSGLNKEAADKISPLLQGDTLTLGNYHDATEWIVLEVSGTRIHLLSKYVVDCRRFDGNDKNWADSELRKWLNSEYFNECFTDSEKAIIEEVDNDKVTLLSIEEAEKLTEEVRRAEPTAYAKGKGIHVNSNNCSYWWLRSPGFIGSIAAYVNFSGYVFVSGTYVNINYGVRPALWINLGS